MGSLFTLERERIAALPRKVFIRFMAQCFILRFPAFDYYGTIAIKHDYIYHANDKAVLVIVPIS